MKSQISPLMDGNIALEDAECLYTTLKSGGGPAQAGSNYHLIGDAMRGDPVFKPDFTERLLANLEGESVLLWPTVKRKQALFKNSKLWSLAAFVFAVALVGWVVSSRKCKAGSRMMRQRWKLHKAYLPTTGWRTNPRPLTIPPTISPSQLRGVVGR